MCCSSNVASFGPSSSCDNTLPAAFGPHGLGCGKASARVEPAGQHKSAARSNGRAQDAVAPVQQTRPPNRTRHKPAAMLRHQPYIIDLIAPAKAKMVHRQFLFILAGGLRWTQRLRVFVTCVGRYGG